MKSKIYIFTFFLICFTGFLSFSCEDEIDPIDNTNQNNNGTGSSNNSGNGNNNSGDNKDDDTNIDIISFLKVNEKGSMNPKGILDTDVLSPTYGKYVYSFEFGFAVDANTYRHGIEQVVAHITAGDGSFSVKTTERTKDISLSIRESKDYKYWSIITVYSTEKNLTITYSFEYYKSGKWNKIGKEESLEIIGIGNNEDIEDPQDPTWVDWEAPYLYKIDGKEFRMILVESEELGDFYMMQTELPPHSEIDICGMKFGPCDSNNDNAITKSEYSRLLKALLDATGINFRLPTRMEWQYAAKGGKKSKGYTYAGSNIANEVAWHKGITTKPQAIAQKKPNELGLYDMSGNYAEVTYETNKEDGVDGDICGGSFRDDSSNCKWSSWYEGNKGTGYISQYSRIRHQGAFDAHMETIRLIFRK